MGQGARGNALSPTDTRISAICKAQNPYPLPPSDAEVAQRSGAREKRAGAPTAEERPRGGEG